MFLIIRSKLLGKVSGGSILKEVALGKKNDLRERKKVLWQNFFLKIMGINAEAGEGPREVTKPGKRASE